MILEKFIQLGNVLNIETLKEAPPWQNRFFIHTEVLPLEVDGKIFYIINVQAQDQVNIHTKMGRKIATLNETDINILKITIISKCKMQIAKDKSKYRRRKELDNEVSLLRALKSFLKENNIKYTSTVGGVSIRTRSISVNVFIDKETNSLVFKFNDQNYFERVVDINNPNDKAFENLLGIIKFFHEDFEKTRVKFGLSKL